jgi:hypothetical protein
MKVAIVNKETLEIASWYDAEEANQGMYGGPWGQPEQFAHLELASGDPRAMKAVLNEENELELQVDAALQEAAAEQDMNSLRAERNTRLSACDWTQLPDSPLSVEDKALWATYRQNLRDLPENTLDPLNPEWPEQP